MTPDELTGKTTKQRKCAAYGEFPISAIMRTAGLCALPG